jgi:hypothetical protein
MATLPLTSLHSYRRIVLRAAWILFALAVRRAMAEKPEDRFGMAGEFASALVF